MADQPGPDANPSVALLVGREREQAALRTALAAALAGRGALVLIGGEAGIGKTALAEAACAEATGRGALVLVGRCYDLSETPPYGPWAEVLARAPRAPTTYPRRPLVLLLDDLHWADPASLDLLRALARRLAAHRLLLVATYRADELTRRRPLYQLLPMVVREARAERLDLRPLDAAGLRALVARYALAPADEGRLVAHLNERSEGNPFFAGELLRALEEEGALRRARDAWALGDLGRSACRRCCARCATHGSTGSGRRRATCSRSRRCSARRCRSPCGRRWPGPTRTR